MVEDDPYKGPEPAARRGDKESAAYAVIQEEAPAAGLPDDALTLSQPALRFTDATVSSQVRVTVQDGSRWARGADDHSERSARRVSGGPAAVPNGADPGGSVEVRLHAGDARVQVLRRGELRRRRSRVGGADSPALT